MMTVSVFGTGPSEGSFLIESIRQFLHTQLATNEFFSGGMILMAVGAAVALLRDVPRRVGHWVWRRVILTVTVRSEDEAFQWVQHWLALQPYSARARRLTAFSARSERERERDEKAGPKVRFAPDVGTHWFFYRGTPLSLHRERNEPEEGGRSVRTRESFQIRMMSRNRQVVVDLLEEARRLYLPESDVLSVMVSTYGTSWESAFRQPRRPADTLVLADGLWEEVVADARQFLASEDYYHAHGVPHRRGYLLHGPPGSGKTSLVKTLASELGLDLAVLNLNRADLDDDELLSLLGELSEKRVILLLEDIDAIFADRRRSDDANRSGVTFSGLLNALDGVGSAGGLMMVMTTNHPGRLDPALIRPGRCDRRFHLGAPTPAQAERLFRNMIPGHDGLAGRFGRLLTNPTASMAALQDLCLRHRFDPPALFDDPEALAVLGGRVPTILAEQRERCLEVKSPEGGPTPTTRT